MITIFNRREVLVTPDRRQMDRVCDELAGLGIAYLIRVGGLGSAGRYRGIPGMSPEAGTEYRVYIRNQDYPRYRNR